MSIPLPFSIPPDLEQKLKSFFEIGDAAGVETQCFLFGTGSKVTHLVIPDQSSEQCSVQPTQDGRIQLAQFASENSALHIMAWAHSHHTLKNTPSMSDVSAQFAYQRDIEYFCMIIANVEKGITYFGLTPDAMISLKAGESMESVDLTTLVTTFFVKPNRRRDQTPIICRDIRVAAASASTEAVNPTSTKKVKRSAVKYIAHSDLRRVVYSLVKRLDEKFKAYTRRLDEAVMG